MTMTAVTITQEQFLEGARSAVLEALDGYMRDLSGSERARGATDGDLPHLFAALDAHMLRVAKRFNDPHSQEVGSACLSIDLT